MFTDVVAAGVHSASIECLSWWGIAFGRGGSFLPGDTVNRAQLASFLARAVDASGFSLPAAGAAFPDIADSPHREAIERLAAAGIITGRVDGTFDPGGAVNREQMSALVVRTYEHLTGIDLVSADDHFVDDDGSIHEASIDEAAAAGFVRGFGDGRFGPSEEVRRDHAASMLVRMLALLVEGGQSRLPS